MTKEYYEKYYKNGELQDCAAFDMKYIAFILKDVPQTREDDEKELSDFPTRLIAYVPEKSKFGEFASVRWDYGIEQAFVSGTHHYPIVVDQYFEINEIKSKTNWYDIPNNERGSLAKGITNIDGEVYAYGMVRSVFRRTGVKTWENITTEEKYPNLYADVNKSKSTFVGDFVGFSALDGFNANDIYAGGNQGDFWHYNGKEWRRIDLPTNADISTITCSKDGRVYVGSRIGNVVIGRENSWEVIKGRTYEMTHSCWFDGKVYFSSQDGRIYTYDETKKDLVEATFKTSYPKHMHHLIRGIASCDECLVAYASVQAYAYDGEVWHEIIEIPSLSKHK
jgi:hypothetical protein